jgi:riboflavin synthase
MFTGIIHHQGIFKGYREGNRVLAVGTPPSFPELPIGESVAVNGVCLSLARKEGGVTYFDLSQETLSRTNLGSLGSGEKLNLEPPLTLQSLLSGHLVSGHIDATGRVLRITTRKPGRRLTISFPPGLRPYLIPKGSVAVNGVSLTVAAVKPSSFDVELIPLTIQKSNLKDAKTGQKVNLECDIFGKYVYNWLSRGKTGT